MHNAMGYASGLISIVQRTDFFASDAVARHFFDGFSIIPQHPSGLIERIPCAWAVGLHEPRTCLP